MAFQTVAVLDPFTTNCTAAEFAAKYPSWTVIGAGSFEVKTKELKVLVAGEMYWNAASFTENQEAYIQLPTLMGAGKEIIFSLRRTEAAGKVTAILGIFLPNGTIEIFRDEAGTLKELKKGSVAAFEAGDILGMQCIGNVTTLWRNPKGVGAATEILKHEDAAAGKITGAGNVGIFFNDTTVRADNFAAGSLTEAAATIEKPANQTSTEGAAIATVKVKGTNLVTLTSKELPAGLTLTKVSPTEWTITGTPTTAKASTTVTLEAKNGEAVGENTTFTWTVKEAAATIVKPAAQTSTKGTAIATVKVKGTNLDVLTSKELPAGLTLTKVNETEWTITGTPTTTKAITTVTLEARNNEAAGENTTFSWTVEESTRTEPAGTFKFQPVGSSTVKIYGVKNANRDVYHVEVTVLAGYGTEDENIAWILRQQPQLETWH